MDNQKVAKELVRLAKSLGGSNAIVPQKDIDAIARLTDRNDHTGALMYLYGKILRDGKALKALKAMTELHDYFGSMPAELVKLRHNSFYKPGMERVRREFDDETATRIYNSF